MSAIKVRNVIALFVFAILGTAGGRGTFPLAQAALETPQQGIETFLKTIRAMEFPVKDMNRHSQLAQEANGYLDLEALGKKALEKHWDEAAPEDQKAFMELLWSLIEYVAYPRSVSFLGNYEITYPEIKPAGNGFEVDSMVKQQAEGLEAKVVYHVYQRDGHWKIDDVVLDDVSISEDLKYQFDKIIADSKFAGLLDKMRERLAQAKKENGIP